jgi:uncharacterized YigZ family protein
MDGGHSILCPSYSIPAGSHTAELEIKKSRFIAVADHVSTREEAMAVIQTIKSRYPDARHHCWAYQLGDPKSAASAAMSDDGEPSGTAGKPIMNVLSHKNVGDIIVVVARYFGGIKLGAGGLVRAYSSVTDKVMNELSCIAAISSIFLQLTLDFSQEQLIHHWMGIHSGEVLAVTYSSHVLIDIKIPYAQLESLQMLCNAHGIVCELLEI